MPRNIEEEKREKIRKRKWRILIVRPVSGARRTTLSQGPLPATKNTVRTRGTGASFLKQEREAQEEFLCPRGHSWWSWWTRSGEHSGRSGRERRKHSTRSSFYLVDRIYLACVKERRRDRRWVRRTVKTSLVASVNVRQRVANGKGQQPRREHRL